MAADMPESRQVAPVPLGVTRPHIAELLPDAWRASWPEATIATCRTWHPRSAR